MRLIDADAFIEKLAHVPMIQEAIKKAMDTMPTIEAVPVVRCEHCAHKKNCQWYYYSGDDYGFCNWAVREEHEQAYQCGRNSICHR